MMSRITVTLAALIFTVGAAFSQIRPKQIGWPPSDTAVYVIVNDTTAGATQGLGKWFPVDSLPGGGGVDSDWLKVYTGTIPTITDSMYHNGPVTIGADTMLTGILNVIGRIDQRYPAGIENVAIGRDVMSSGSVTGDENIAVGATALRDLTNGEKNTAIGFGAMQENSSGSGNLAIGEAALQANTTGSTNVAIGRLALSGGGAPENNVGIGYNAGQFCTTAHNVIIGYEAVGAFDFAFGGGENVAVGAYAGYGFAGADNVAIGDSAGYSWTGSDALFIDNGPTATPLIRGDFAADSVHVHGKLGYSNDAGDPDRLAGLAGTQFTSVYTGFGLMITNDTLYVDTTQTGSGGGGGGANLTIEGSGPAYIIASSSGTDVDVSSDGIIILTEPSPNELNFAVDTSILATQYDITQIAEDEDWYELGTTDPPNAITDTMYHTGITAIGETTGSDMFGQLSIGPDGGADAGVSIVGYLDSNYPQIAMYPGGDEDYGWEIVIEDDNAFYLRQKYGTPNIPFGIETGAPAAGLLLQGDGDVLISDYPNTRDDGTAANFLGTDANGEIRSYDIGDVISEWYLVATGTPGSETITDGETVTFAGGGINTVTRSGSTITITGTEADGSTTNELNTIEENNSTVQTSNNRLDFQTLFDVATDGAGEVNISLDMGEATAVTLTETDDYLLMWDSGLGQHQRMLWTDFLPELILFEENDGTVGTGDQMDFQTGFDLTMSPTNEANIALDFSEFTTDASPEGDEFVILSDGAGTQEKVAISYFGSGDTNFAEDNLTFTGNRTHTTGIYTLDLQGTVMNMTLRDQNGSTGKNIKLTSELGAGNGVTGGIGFSYETGGVQTPQFETQAYKWSTTKQTLSTIAEQGTDAYIVYEKNAGFNDNTTESHVAINGGVAFTQNYEWTDIGADLTLDRSFHIVNVGGIGTTADEINLPEVATAGDNWTGGITDAQVQVGQEYVITNFRSATNLIIRTFTGDIINDNEGGSGATYTLGPGTSVILKCVRFASGIGYWFTYD